MVKRESISTTHHNKNIDNGFPHSTDVDNPEWNRNSSPPAVGPEKTQMTQLRLERDGYSNIIIHGTVAQLVEHLIEAQGVGGSNPSRSTESRINGKPPLPYGSQSVNLMKWGC